MTQLLNACLQNMRTKQAAGHFRSGETPLSLFTSALVPAAIGGGIGALFNSGGDRRDMGQGAILGALLGGGVANSAINIGSLVSGLRAGKRTKQESEDYDKINKWKNWLIPGVGTYNSMRSAVEMDQDNLRAAIDAYESGHNVYAWDDAQYKNMKDLYKQYKKMG